MTASPEPRSRRVDDDLRERSAERTRNLTRPELVPAGDGEPILYGDEDEVERHAVQQQRA